MNAIERAELLEKAERFNRTRSYSEVRALLEGVSQSEWLSEPFLAYLLAVAWRQTGNLTGAHELAVLAERQASMATRSSLYRKLRNLQGILAIDLGDLNLAEDCFSDALSAAYAAEDNMLAALAVAHLGIIADIRCDWTSALSCYQRSKAHWEREGNHLYRGLCLHNLGMTFRQLSLLDHADKSFREASWIFSNYGGPDDGSPTAIERALLFLVRGEAEIAEFLIHRALERAISSNHTMHQGEALRVKGMVELRKGNVKSAYESLKAAERIARSAQAKLLLAEVNEVLIAVEITRGRERGAARRADMAATLYRQIGAPNRAESVTDKLISARQAVI
jgi:tetratricopeptide (TPR) repeat protein